MMGGVVVRGTVVHVSPHPDDEILGAGATLILLREHGWRVLNLTCSLGRPHQHARRLRELETSVSRAGFHNRVLDLPLSRNDDLPAAGALIATELGRILDETDAPLVLSPHPGDGHHAHETVASAVADVVAGRPGITWWRWGLWVELARPTLLTAFGEATLATVQHAMDAYLGENARNPFDELLPARSRASMILGSERVFGFGSARASQLPYAELFEEVRASAGDWLRGPPRLLDPAEPLPRLG